MSALVGFAGVRVRDLVTSGMTVASAMLVAVGSCLVIGVVIGVADSGVAGNLLLPALGAALLGGVSVYGSRGGFAGVILAVGLVARVPSATVATRLPSAGQRISRRPPTTG